MTNLFKSIKSELDEWGEAIIHRAVAKALRIFADISEAPPTLATTLRAKADELEGDK